MKASSQFRLYLIKNRTSLPVEITQGGETSAITFVEPNDIEKALDSPELPGEIDLLDAWSLYYRGRQSDAIRSLITSLEVLLEAKTS